MFNNISLNLIYIYLNYLHLANNQFFPSTNLATIIAQTVFPAEFNKVAGASIIVPNTVSIGNICGENPNTLRGPVVGDHNCISVPCSPGGSMV